MASITEKRNAILIARGTQEDIINLWGDSKALVGPLYNYEIVYATDTKELAVLYYDKNEEGDVVHKTSFGTFLRADGKTPARGNINLNGHDIEAIKDLIFKNGGKEGRLTTELSDGLTLVVKDFDKIFLDGVLEVSGKSILRNVEAKDITADNLNIKNLTLGEDLKVAGTLEVDGKTTLNDDLDIGKNLKVVGTSTLVGDVGLNNNLTVEGTTTLNDNLTVAANAQVTGKTETGTLTSGDTTLTGTLDVAGKGTFTAGVKVTEGLETDTLISSGKATLDNLEVTNETVLKGVATVEKTLTVNEDLKVVGETETGTLKSGNATLTGTLGVDGKSTLNEVETQGLNVKGDAVFDKNVNVGGKLNVTGETTLGDKLIVKAGAEFEDITVTNKTTTGTLEVIGTSKFNENVTIGEGKNLTVGGNLYVAGESFVVEAGTLSTDDDVIELRRKAESELVNPAGIAIKKYDGVNHAGIVIKKDGELRVGKIELDENGKILNEAASAQPILTREEKDVLDKKHGYFLGWDSENKRAVGAYRWATTEEAELMIATDTVMSPSTTWNAISVAILDGGTIE